MDSRMIYIFHRTFPFIGKNGIGVSAQACLYKDICYSRLNSSTVKPFNNGLSLIWLVYIYTK